MGAQRNLAPVIIKRKKIIAAGHHGGAWKVAYADFVTAMMAFFMMMWLLNATTEQQRQGLADYFSPTIPINRISGGGDGAFGGDSIFSEDTLPQNGLGASDQHATQKHQNRGDSGMSSEGGERDQADAEFQKLVDALRGRGGESTVVDNLEKHIVTRITDEGLVIEIFALEDFPLFEEATDIPTLLMSELMNLISSVIMVVENDVAIGGHVRSNAIVATQNPVWDMSSQRATQTRLMLQTGDVNAQRIMRVTGHADRESADRNPMSVRNDRIEIVLLR